MIVICYNPRHLAEAQDMRDALEAAYQGRLPISLLEANHAGPWPAEPSWDDLLIVPFDDQPPPPAGQEFLIRETGRSAGGRSILPVALLPSHPAPPGSIEHLKALPWDDTAKGPKGRLVRRVGAMLGLKLRNRDQTIFVSYRTADGSAAAVQIERFFKDNGYQVWRDEAHDESDDETSIPPGQDVQKVIEKNLARADLLLLLDTPDASASRWIKLEVDLANGQLIPVLPLLFLRPKERQRISRFRSLATLQRGCELRAELDGSVPPLNDDELAHVLAETEDYLADIFRRKLRVPFLVEKEFTNRGFQWNSRDHLIYEALRRRRGLLINTRVFSHCAHLEGIYDPSLAALIKHFGSVEPRANYAFYIYDGQLIPRPQIEEISASARIEDSTDVVILHYQELATVLQDSF